MWTMPWASTNDLNFWLVNAVPLSDTICSGIPCTEKISASFLIVTSEEVELTMWTSIHLEWASINIR